jgi:SulP family sulfate permease
MHQAGPADVPEQRQARLLDMLDDGVVVLDAETTPFIDVSAAQTLAELNQQLKSRRVTLLIARDVGQFRDVLEHVPGYLPLSYPSIADAVTASACLTGR